MVYNFDKYVEQFPKRNVSIIKKFESEAKNLHEMSTDEINNIISTWGAVIPATATNQKSIISLYFDWLKKEGIPVKADIDGIVIPVKSTEFLIYSSEILHEYWDKFFKSCEREAAKSGKSFGRDKYLASYVSGILSFYGLTSEQILALDLSDVQPEGVIGYNIPLTQNDLDVLIEYKNLKEFSNNKKVNGYKYIRAAGVVNEDTLDRGINHGACESKDKYLKRLLTFRNAYKKDYEAYRSERMAYEAKHGSQLVNVVSNSLVVEKKPDVNELLESLKYIDSTIAEVEKIKTNLLGIKAQIQKFIK